MREMALTVSVKFQSTLSLRRATVAGAKVIPVVPISIHALLAESDDRFSRFWAAYPRFQSTLSLRRATVCNNQIFRKSIYFNPRSPCGERRGWVLLMGMPMEFQSTLSLRRATGVVVVGLGGVAISIHALLAESDASSVMAPPQAGQFQSTLSLRRATFPRHAHGLSSSKFQSTLSLRRATRIVI